MNLNLKGALKKQEHFRAQLGPDGKPQKIFLDPPANPEPHRGPLIKHIEEKKEEFKECSD